jgi:LacI family transcriptional regulator
MSNGKRANFSDIAKRAGVSESTVDRVLNERGSVSDAKRRLVLDAARGMGLRRILPAASHGVLRFDVIFAKGTSDHFRRVEHAIVHYAQLVGPKVVVQRHNWIENDEAQLLELIERPRIRRHGLVVVAHDTPTIRDALQRVIDTGLPVVVLTSDIAGLHGHTFVGIDNHAAGRTAAHLLGRLVPKRGDVMLLVNSLRYRAHQQRVAGFLEVMQSEFRSLRIVGPGEGFDQPARNRRWLGDAWRDAPRPVAIYSTGAGSAGIADVLRAIPEKPVWITHEATAEHASMLRDGSLSLVLDQDSDAQALACLQQLLYVHGEVPAPPVARPTFRLVTVENLPDAL